MNEKATATMEAPEVSVIIPTLNEETSLPIVLKKLAGYPYEIIVVDGHSRDKTVEIAREHKATVIYDDIGKGSAIRAGLATARGRYLIMMDADDSHNPDEIPAIVRKLKEGYGIVMPSRFIDAGKSDDISGFRTFGNNFYRFWIRLLWHTDYTDVCYGFRGLTREAYKRMGLEADGFDIDIEMSIKTIKHGLKYVELPSHERQRHSGEAKLGFWTSLTLDKRVLKELLTN
jgi:glycosyltransferase involved in cell wall biosynthesis